MDRIIGIKAEFDVSKLEIVGTVFSDSDIESAKGGKFIDGTEDKSVTSDNRRTQSDVSASDLLGGV